MAYVLRTSKGEAKAVFSNSIAKRIFDNAPGHFRVANYISGNKQTVFEVEEDMVYTPTNAIDFSIYLFKGDTVCPTST